MGHRRQVAEHRVVVAALAAEHRSELLARSNAAGLRQLATHLGALASTTSLIMVRVPFWPLVMVVQGILINFLFTALHETVHRTPFKTRALNDWVGRACAFLVLLGAEHFRHFHMAHHRYTNEPGNDPELDGPRPATTSSYLKYLSGLIEWVHRIRSMLVNAFRANTEGFVPERAKSAIRREARVQLFLYCVLGAVSVLAGSAVLVFVWVLPLVLGGPFLRGYLLAEHAGCPDDPSMFINTRTTYTSAVVRRLAWNMPYHIEHHSFPGVPFHQLPAFHAHIREHLPSTEAGYARFNKKYLESIKSGSEY